MTKDKIKKNFDRGMSLLELMVSSGFIVLIGFLGLRIQNMGDSYMASFSDNAELQKLINEIRYNTSNKFLCESFFKGQSLGEITNLQKAGAANPLVAVGENLVNNTMKVSQLTLNQIDNNQVSLSITLNRTGDNNQVKEFSREVILNAQVQGGVIESCFGNTYSIIEDTKKSLCSEVGGEYDDVAKTCIHIGVSTTPCGTNEYLAGLTYDATNKVYRAECATIPGFATACDPATRKFPYEYNVVSSQFECRTIEYDEVADDINTGALNCKNFEALGFTSSGKIRYQCN